MMKHLIRRGAGPFVVVAGLWGTAGAPAAPAKTARAEATPEAREQQFAQDLTGATLAGKFTEDGKDGAPGDAVYSITKAEKEAGDDWRLMARMQYHGHDLTLPVTVAVKWAGDTPVIEVTDKWVPGLGTYTARVLVYRDRFAGTWSGGDHAGAMWGRVEHGAGHEAPATTKPAP